MLVHVTGHSNVMTFFRTWLSMTRSEGSYVVEEVFYATGKHPLASVHEAQSAVDRSSRTFVNRGRRVAAITRMCSLVTVL